MPGVQWFPAWSGQTIHWSEICSPAPRSIRFRGSQVFISVQGNIFSWEVLAPPPPPSPRIHCLMKNHLLFMKIIFKIVLIHSIRENKRIFGWKFLILKGGIILCPIPLFFLKKIPSQNWLKVAMLNSLVKEFLQGKVIFFGENPWKLKEFQ